MNRTLALILSACALGAADDRANDYWLRLSAAAWGPSQSGQAGFTTDGRDPGTADLADLGLDGTQTGLMADVDVQVPIIFLPDVHLGAWTTASEGSGTLGSTQAIGDTTFAAGSKVDSTLDLTDLWAELSWRPIDFGLAGFAVGLGVHALDIHLEEKASGTTATFDETLPIPVLVLRGHVNPIPSLGFEAILHGMNYNDTNFLDLRAQAVWRPMDWLGVMAGWRHVALDATIDDGQDHADLNLTLSGPYLGALVQL